MQGKVIITSQCKYKTISMVLYLARVCYWKLATGVFFGLFEQQRDQAGGGNCRPTRRVWQAGTASLGRQPCWTSLKHVCSDQNRSTTIVVNVPKENDFPYTTLLNHSLITRLVVESKENVRILQQGDGWAQGRYKVSIFLKWKISNTGWIDIHSYRLVIVQLFWD